MLLILGDIHGEYDLINKQIEYVESNYPEKVKAVIQLGDFGIFREQLTDYFQKNRKDFIRPVYCIDGNHEDFLNIEILTKKYQEHFTYLGRGDTHEIEGYNFLSFGGSAYMDPINTPPGAVIRAEDIKKSILQNCKKIDIVISHDCPMGIGVPGTPGFEYCGPTGFKNGLSLLKHFKPKIWFFAHYHKWFSVYVGQTRFLGVGLARDGFVLLRDDFSAEIINLPINNKKPKKFFNIVKEMGLK
jgi:Icc-related predicted phosphoesterase